jgi:hypothetical protein
VRESDVVISTLIIKIRNGDIFALDEKALLDTWFKSREQSMIEATFVIRLFHRNHDIEEYYQMACDTLNTIAGLASDIICGYKNNEQRTSTKTKMHKMSVAQTGGLPYVLKLLDKPYMIASSIDIDDGLVNGAVATLKYSEWDYKATNYELRVKWLWFHLQQNAVGKAARI